MIPGRIALVLRDDRVVAARITAVRAPGYKAEVATPSGPQVVRIEPDDLCATLQASAATWPAVQDRVARAQARLTNADVELAWQLMAEGPVGTTELARLLCGGDSADDRDDALLVVGLRDDEFAMRRGQLQRRTAEERAVLATDRALLAQHEARLAPLLSDLQRLRMGHRAARLSWAQTASEIEAWLRAGAPPDPWMAVLLARTGRHKPPGTRDAAELLVELGHWDIHDDVDLYVSGLLQQPPDTPFVQSPSEVTADLPVLDLSLVTIDNDAPHEIDDALGAEIVPDGVRLWVAIAHPTRWFGPDDPLDLAALERGATLYHPRHVAGMLPDTFACQDASLLAGQDRPALVFAATVDANGVWRDPWVGERKVRVHGNWQYSKVDAWLAGDGGNPPDVALARLLDATTRALEAERIRNGAWLLYKPEVEVRAPRHQRVQIRDASQTSASRRIVTEAMVLAGAIAAQFASDHHILLPFRHQPPPQQPPLPPGSYTDPVQVYSLLRCLQPAATSLQARPHGVMAVPAYAQVTSPLRRYTDLLAHRQLVAQLRGLPPMDAQVLTDRITRAEAAMALRRPWQRKSDRYFKLQAIAELGHAPRLPAVIVRPLAQGVLAFVPQFALEVPLRQRNLHVGDHVTLQVRQVQPPLDRLDILVL